MIHWIWLIITASLGFWIGWFVRAAFTEADRTDRRYIHYTGEDPWWHQN